MLRSTCATQSHVIGQVHWCRGVLEEREDGSRGVLKEREGGSRGMLEEREDGRRGVQGVGSRCKHRCELCCSRGRMAAEVLEEIKDGSRGVLGMGG